MQPQIAVWLCKAKMLSACSDYCQTLNLAGVSEKLMVRCEYFHAFRDLSSQAGDQAQMFTVILPKRPHPKGGNTPCPSLDLQFKFLSSVPVSGQPMLSCRGKGETNLKAF